MFAPAAELLAVTNISPSPVIAKAPNETMVAAVVPVPLMVIPLAAVTFPARATAELAFALLLIVTDPAVAVIVPVDVPLIPALVVALELVDAADKVILPIVDVMVDVKYINPTPAPVTPVLLILMSP